MSDVNLFDSQDAASDSLAKKKESIAARNPSAMEVKLSSIGKLSFPAKVWVRDYNMDDATRMSMATEENQIDVLVDVLQGMIQDKNLDARLLTEPEMMEIMLTVYSNFWNKTMENVPYPWDESELKGLPRVRQMAIKEGKEVPRINLYLPTAVITKTLSKEFREPFTIKGKGENAVSVSFRLPRVGDTLAAKERVYEEYAYEEKEFEDIEATMNKVEETKAAIQDTEVQLESVPEGEESDEVRGQLSMKKEALENTLAKLRKAVDPARLSAFRKMREEKARKLLRYRQASLLVAYNGVILNTEEEKIAAYEKVSLQTWKDFASVLTQFEYGVVNQITVKSPLTGKEVVKPFRFRLLDFVPAPESGSDSGYTVSFGSVPQVS